ncbi:MAG: CRISPR-associated helicase Cas3' [Firmicutes bacterium]|nr:CRISPR-associated helicase Cas3' [Bacillota bacterium]
MIHVLEVAFILLSPTCRSLWAKVHSSNRNPMPEQPGFHPLICHLLDTAMVARALWDSALSPARRAALARGLDVNPALAAAWLALGTGLHDLGKASPVFQMKCPQAKERLQGAGLRFHRHLDPRRQPHGIITTAVVEPLLTTAGMPYTAAWPLAVAVGGHHGVFPRPEDIVSVDTRTAGDAGWVEVRAELFTTLNRFCETVETSWHVSLDSPGILIALAGLTSLCDWIASDERYFPYADSDFVLEDYISIASGRAQKALRELGWTDWAPVTVPASFSSLFNFSPRPLQAAVEELAEQLTPPALVILEAPMGEGKTEAAMFLADHWAASGHQGCYFALPTQATSNQMFSRVHHFLAKRYPSDRVQLQLLHGHASLSAEFDLLRRQGYRPPTPSGIEEDPGYDGAPAGVVASEWFTHRKRGLLAPFGVGTVDQALLSVLQTKHYFVRLAGLMCKTVIIDEAHAYDTYMSKLLELLLAWLGALGCTVVVLSATLPAARRRKLVDAFRVGTGTISGDTSEAQLSNSSYPRLTWTCCTSAGSQSLTTSDTTRRLVEIKWVDGHLPMEADHPFPLGEALRAAIAEGGTAAVICNTVGQAQDVYQALSSYFPEEEAGDGHPVLDLFHARYLFADRQSREQRTLGRFGKNPGGNGGAEGGCVIRPNRAVLVATQVIEQSLDLDFDLMVTYLAPVDLVLQRSGRLHRHERLERPHHLQPAALWICKPKTDADGLPVWDPGAAVVYDSHILLRTWLELRSKSTLNVPADVEPLVEAVYSDSPCPGDLPIPWQSCWQKTRQELEEKQRISEGKAQLHRIWPPEAGNRVMGQFNARLEEDNPNVHHTLQALTRLTAPTVSVVCLFGSEVEAYADAERQLPVNLDQEPDHDATIRLLQRTLTVSHRGLVPRLVGDGHAPLVWRRSPLLRHHRVLFFDTQGFSDWYGWRLHLHHNLGLLINQSRKEVN